MKKVGYFGGAAVLFLFVFALKPAHLSAQDAQNFSVSSFTADYYLDKNAASTSSLRTVENIAAQFPDFDQNHGILRALPESYQGHTLSLKVDSVTDDNNLRRNYTTSEQNGNLVLKIGDADTYVHGLQTYRITYEELNVAGIYNDHDEFYWNVNGDQWQQPFGQVTATVHVAQNLQANVLTGQHCYVGYAGQTDESSCIISATPEQSIFSFTAQHLLPSQTMTFVIGFKPGTFKLGPEIAAAKRAHNIKVALIAGAAALPPLASLVYLFRRWRKFGRDPKGRGTIIPEYQPPKGLNVLTSDYVFEEALKQKAISALVIELAVHKYLSISEYHQDKKFMKNPVSYKLKLLKDPGDLTPIEKSVINMFFGVGAAVGSEADLATLKNKLSTDVVALKKKLASSLMGEGYFSNNPDSAGKVYYSIGVAMAIGGFFLFSVFAPAAASIILTGLIFLAFGRYMPARSQLGVETHDYMLGLRDYIKTAEADRLKFLQSPEGAEKIEEAGLDPKDPQFKIKLFESLLPYAMVFGLEKQWAKQFADVYKSPPGWYNGNWATFNTIYLASALGGFSSASAVSFTAPGGGGGSGFSGGFSGGGGGGGGGGGW